MELHLAKGSEPCCKPSRSVINTRWPRIHHFAKVSSHFNFNYFFHYNENIALKVYYGKEY